MCAVDERLWSVCSYEMYPCPNVVYSRRQYFFSPTKSGLTMCRFPVTFLTAMLPYTRHAGPASTRWAVLENTRDRDEPLAARIIEDADVSCALCRFLRFQQSQRE